MAPPAIGAVLLAAALGIGGFVAFSGEPPAVPSAGEPERWHLRAAALAEGDAFLREGEAWVGQVPVQHLLVREMVATLSWEDDAPGSAGDEFTLELVPPNGLPAPAPAEGTSGTLELRIPLYVRGPPPQDANLGAGGWTLRVYLRDGGDASTLGVLPGEPDWANGFRLRVDATVWERG